MSGRNLFYPQVLDEGDVPLGLFKYLTKRWAVPEAPHELTASRSLDSNTDYGTGAVTDTVFLVLKSLGDFVLRGAEGINKLALLVVNKYGLVSVLHSLFQIGESAYEDGPVKLFALRGEIPSGGVLAIVQLEAIHFALNTSFVGTPRLDFEGHLSRFNSSLP